MAMEVQLLNFTNNENYLSSLIIEYIKAVIARNTTDTSMMYPLISISSGSRHTKPIFLVLFRLRMLLTQYLKNKFIFLLEKTYIYYLLAVTHASLSDNNFRKSHTIKTFHSSILIVVLYLSHTKKNYFTFDKQLTFQNSIDFQIEFQC